MGDVNHDGKIDIVSAGYGGTSVSVQFGNGDGTFQAAISYGNSAVSSVTLADVNHDGNLDILTAGNNYNGGAPASLQVLLGKGDGTFGAALGYYDAGGLISVVVADFNGDGNLDVEGMNSSGYSATFSILLGKGDGTFVTAPTYAVNGAPQVGVSADFNNDGIPDIAVPTSAGYAGILLGKGDGTFQPVISSFIGENAGSSSLTVGDFNGDGKLDLASSNPYPAINLSVLLGNGDGTFKPAVDYIADSIPNFVATGDVNGDGKLDLVAANQGGDVSVLLGNGDGTFRSAVNYNAGSYPFGSVLADFNGDGHLDIAVANEGNGGPGGISVLLGKGDGTFGTATQYGQLGFVGSVVAGDLNGDGMLDLVFAGSDLTTYIGIVGVLLGNGDGTFQTALEYPAGSIPYGVILADYNGDGKLDAAAGDYNGGVNVLLGNGDGSLQPATVYAAALEPAYLLTGDFNRDGAMDLVASNMRQSAVSVLLNAGGTLITTASSLNPSAVGGPVTFTATVAASIVGIPGQAGPIGSVTFIDGTALIGTVNLSGGSASVTASSLSLGSHSITATYSGDAQYNPHVGPVVTQNVVSGPLVGLSGTSLTFANQSVGTTSGRQMVTLTNTGVATLTIASVTATGDFSATKTCGTSLAAGSSCSVGATFAPTQTGTRTGTLSIYDNAPGSPQVITLTGTGVAPAVLFSPTSLQFTSQLVGISSSAQMVTLTNSGTATLTLTTISFAGKNPADFQQTHTCAGSLSAGASCSISVTFHPQASGSRGASLSLSDNAAGSPQVVSLSGVGTVVTLSATSINFGSHPVGKTSAPNTLTLTNSGQVALSIQSIAITGINPGDFAQTNTCRTSVAAGKSCSIQVTFTPAKKGNRSAAVAITDSGGGSPQTVTLTGSGS